MDSVRPAGQGRIGSDDGIKALRQIIRETKGYSALSGDDDIAWSTNRGYQALSRVNLDEPRRPRGP